MTGDVQIEFLKKLAVGGYTNVERWAALVWLYAYRERSHEATVRQICQDMEAAGYGKQNATRVLNALKKDRRLTRYGDDAFGVRVTASSKLAEKYLPIVGVMPTAVQEKRDDVVEAVLRDSAPAENTDAQARKNAGQKPALFIGSSVEGLKYARALESQLMYHAEVTIWKDGVFGLGKGTLEALVEASGKFDFAVLVLTADDLSESRGRSQSAPRDNVVFELGLFMGRIGRFRTFIVYDKDAAVKLPSDLAGVTAAQFLQRGDGNYHSQMSPPATLILDAIEKLGRLVRRAED